MKRGLNRIEGIAETLAFGPEQFIRTRRYACTEGTLSVDSTSTRIAGRSKWRFVKEQPLDVAHLVAYLRAPRLYKCDEQSHSSSTVLSSRM